MNYRDLLVSAARDAETDAKAYENYEHGPYTEAVASCRKRAADFLALAGEIDALSEDKARLDWLETNRWAAAHFGKHQYVRGCLDGLREAAAGLRKNADLLDGRD